MERGLGSGVKAVRVVDRKFSMSTRAGTGQNWPEMDDGPAGDPSLRN